MAFLRDRLKPVVVTDHNKINKWITELDSDQFAIRQSTAKELEKVGDQVQPPIQKTLEEAPSLETRRRLEQISNKEKRKMRRQRSPAAWAAYNSSRQEPIVSPAHWTSKTGAEYRGWLASGETARSAALILSFAWNFFPKFPITSQLGTETCQNLCPATGLFS